MNTNNPLRIVFMGTPDFAAAALRAIIDAGHDVVAVYSQPPRPKGRGQAVQKSPVHECAEEAGIPVHHPTSLKSNEEKERFQSLNADIAIVAAYGLILPQEVLDAPRFGCVNIHASLLPRWRGASPIQHAIWKGDARSGVTLMQMEAGLDTGPMIEKGVIELDDHITAAELHDELADMGAQMVLDLLSSLAEHDALPPAETQDDALSNYAPMLKKDDGRVDWTQGVRDIHAQVRALNPWPGVFCETQGGAVLKVKASELVVDHVANSGQQSGTILNKHGDVICGDGQVLRLKTVQPAGKAAMDFASALNGRYIQIGDILS